MLKIVYIYSIRVCPTQSYPKLGVTTQKVYNPVTNLVGVDQLFMQIKKVNMEVYKVAIFIGGGKGMPNNF